MLIDTRTLEQDTVQSDVCIVGAGPAGITLALQLASHGLEVCLIESGGLNAESDTLDLNRGYSLGLPYAFGPGNRSRHLGGSSNCWGGFTQRWAPWDHWDRPWVRDSGWPFRLETLEPYYARVENMLRIDGAQYSMEWWAQRLSAPDLARFPLDPQNLGDAMSALTPMRFGDYWREALSQSRRIRVLLWANACEIEADRPATRVTAVKMRTLSGRTLRATARRFVIAAGGIETPRLLLASRGSMPEGLGNGAGLVGRYFMDHPRLYWGDVRLRDAFAGNRLYDIKFNFIRTPLRIGQVQGSGVFRLPYPVQKRERLTNSQVWLRSFFYGESTGINMALSRMQQRLPGGRPPGFGFFADLATLLGQPVKTTATALGHLTRSRRFVDRMALEGIFEPEPNRESRVSLSGDMDPLGMPRAQVDWRLTANDWRTMDRTMNLVADELERQEIAEIVREDPVVEGQASVEGTWHHMGTARMHASASRGVVDADCRVHGLANLFIAGSSVFPTAGANHPTVQLLALAYRLGDHLAAGHGDEPAIGIGSAWRTPGESVTAAAPQADAGSAAGSAVTPPDALPSPADASQSPDGASKPPLVDGTA